jgi:hypothetical protein
VAKPRVPKVRLRPRTAPGVTVPAAAALTQERVKPTRHTACDPEFWTVINEITDPVPIAPAELDAIESYFSAVLDAVFDPGRKTSTST